MSDWFLTASMWLGGVALIGLAIVGLAVLYTLPVWLLWNWLMPRLFSLPTLSLLDAFGLNLLTGFLFRSGGKK